MIFDEIFDLKDLEWIFMFRVNVLGFEVPG